MAKKKKDIIEKIGDIIFKKPITVMFGAGMTVADIIVDKKRKKIMKRLKRNIKYEEEFYC